MSVWSTLVIMNPFIMDKALDLPFCAQSLNAGTSGRGSSYCSYRQGDARRPSWAAVVRKVPLGSQWQCSRNLTRRPLGSIQPGCTWVIPLVGVIFHMFIISISLSFWGIWIWSPCFSLFGHVHSLYQRQVFLYEITVLPDSTLCSPEPIHCHYSAYI